MKALKGVKPEVIKEGKPKFMISGKSGVGKTRFALEFPKVYLIDTESGAVRPQYRKKMTEMGASYMGRDEGSQDFATVIEEVRTLATTKHEYKTLVIDSFSKLYNIARAIAEESLGNEFGRDKKEANRPTRQLMRLLDTIDMTVILVCHQMDKWERKNGEVMNVGTTFDGFDKLEFDLDLWIEIRKNGPQSTYMVKKSRIEALPEGKSFPLDYTDFAKLYGQEIIEGDSVPLAMAAPEQVEKVERLVKGINLDQKIVDKWFTHADVDAYAEMTAEQIGKCIEFVEKKIIELNGPANKEAATPKKVLEVVGKGVK